MTWDLPIAIERPAWLFVCVFAALSYWLRLRPGVPPSAAPASAWIRAALICCIALALSGVKALRATEELTTLFLLDRSDSIDGPLKSQAHAWVVDAAKAAGRSDSAGIIIFGETAAVDASPQKGLKPRVPEALVETGGTDIASALRLARAVLPGDTAHRLVLLSDGKQTSGEMLAEAMALKAADIPVDVVPLSGAGSRDVLVERLESAPETAPKENLDLTARVWSSTGSTVLARLFRDGRLLSSRSAAVPAGASKLSFSDRIEEPGPHSYELFLDDPADLRPENNRAAAAVTVSGPPTLLVIEGEPGRAAGVASAWEKAGIKALSVGRGRIPRTLPELDAYSGVVLADVPAYALTQRGQAELKSYVADLGGGLAMLGGDQSFGLGGYLHSPIEEALPVSMETKKRSKDLSLAIVVILDISGSMAVAPFGVPKIDIAKDGAMKVVEMLGPGQSFGLCAVDTDAHWTVPLQIADQKADIKQMIGGLSAGGGGIYVYTGLDAAYAQLKPVTAAVKHIILFSDAQDSEEQVQGGRSALDLLTQMGLDGITTSVVGLGAPADSDAAFLEEAGKRGGGRFYLTEDIQNVPQIFMRETVLARRSAVIEEPFLPSPETDIEPTRGIDWSKSPELGGYVLAEAKEAADVGLVTHRGDPLLATWRFGLGKSLAFTSDVSGRWSKAWGAWPSAGKLWVQSARWLSRSPSPKGLSLRIEEDSGSARIIVEAASAEGNALNFLQVEGNWLKPDLGRVPIRLQQTGPGRYEAAMPARSPGTYLAHVTAAGEGVALERTGSLIVPYAAEFRGHGTDTAALSRLAELTGGRWDPAPESAFEREWTDMRRPKDLSSLFILLAALLLPIDVALRRLRFRAEAWEPVAAGARTRWDALRERLGQWRSGASAPAPGAAKAAASESLSDIPGADGEPQSSWDRLKSAKERAKKKR